MKNMDEIREKNRRSLERVIKHLGGSKEFVRLAKQYVPNFKIQMIHNWLNMKRGMGTPWQYCFLIQILTDGKFSPKNLRYDMNDKIRKALK